MLRTSVLSSEAAFSRTSKFLHSQIKHRPAIQVLNLLRSQFDEQLLKSVEHGRCRRSTSHPQTSWHTEGNRRLSTNQLRSFINRKVRLRNSVAEVSCTRPSIARVWCVIFFKTTRAPFALGRVRFRRLFVSALVMASVAKSFLRLAAIAGHTSTFPTAVGSQVNRGCSIFAPVLIC